MTDRQLTFTGRTKRVIHASERAFVSVVALLNLAGWTFIPDNTTELLVIALGNIVFALVTVGTWGRVAADDPDYRMGSPPPPTPPRE